MGSDAMMAGPAADATAATFHFLVPFGGASIEAGDLRSIMIELRDSRAATMEVGGSPFHDITPAWPLWSNEGKLGQGLSRSCQAMRLAIGKGA